MNRETVAEKMWVLAQVNDCLDRYSKGIDEADVDQIRECYHPDAVDFEGIYGIDLRGFIELMHRFREPNRPGETMQHAVTGCLPNKLVNAAQVESYLYNVAPPRSAGEPVPETLVGARFIDRFEYRSRRWAIAHRQLVFVYARVREPATNAWDHLTSDQMSLEARSPAEREGRQ